MDLLPRTVGRVGAVREGRVAMSSPGPSPWKNASKISAGLADLAKNLLQLHEEAADNRARQSLINANNELDRLMGDWLARSGDNAEGILEEFDAKTSEIRSRYGAELSGRQLETYRRHFDSALGGMRRQLFSHRARETDRAAIEKNAVLIDQTERRLVQNANDDSGFDVLGNLMEADFNRRGVAREARSVLWENKVNRIAAQRIQSLLAAGDVNGARTLLERYSPANGDPCRMNQETFEQTEAAVNAYARADEIRSGMDDLTRLAEKEIAAAVAAGTSTDETAVGLRSLLRERFPEAARELEPELNARIAEMEKFSRAVSERNEREQFLSLIQLGSYRKASEQFEKHALRMNPEKAARYRELLRRGYGFGDRTHPAAVAARDRLAEAVAEGSYVLNGMEYPLNSVNDCRDFLVRVCDFPWSEDELKFSEKLLARRASPVPAAMLNDAVNGFYPGKKAADFPGLWEFVSNAMPLDRPASPEQVRQTARTFLSARVLKDGWLWDDDRTTGELGPDSGLKMTPLQLYQMMQRQIRQRENNGRSVPQWMRSATPADAGALNRFAAMIGMTLQKGFYKRLPLHDEEAANGDQ